MTLKTKRFVTVMIIINMCIIFTMGTLYYQYKSLNKKNKALDIVMVREMDFNKNDFVEVKNVIPDINVELRYASENNITGKILYSDNRAFLRYGTAVKLKGAQEDLSKMGYSIRIWDAYRPREVQWSLWKVVPDTRYIVNPKTGSVHSRGAAVDVTVVDKNGKELDMPTDFDEFGSKSEREYKGASEIEKKNAQMLEEIMVKSGFNSVFTEWWHFNDTEWKSYGLIDKVYENNSEKKYSLNMQGVKNYSTENISFSTFIKDKIENFNMGNIKVWIKYKAADIKNLFNKYTAEE